jgi:plasmid stability protein
MCDVEHQDVRTTLTLDEDVAARLKAEARRSGRAFKDVVNAALRRGLASEPSRQKRARFVVRARDLGPLQPGLSLDNIGELLERAESPLHR